MLNNYEIASKALSQAGWLEARRKRRRGRSGVLVASTVCVGLMLWLALVTDGNYTGVDSHGAQAPITMLNEAEIVGTILVGVIAFALWVAMTLLCMRKKNGR